MKAFFVGLLFLLAVGFLAGLGVLLYPFLAVLTFSLQFVVGIFIILFAVWLLGKMVIFIWEKLGSKSKEKI